MRLNDFKCSLCTRAFLIVLLLCCNPERYFSKQQGIATPPTRILALACMTAPNPKFDLGTMFEVVSLKMDLENGPWSPLLQLD